MDVCILTSPAPVFLGPARRLTRGLRAAGRRVVLQRTDTGGRYAFSGRLARSGAALFVYIGHGTAAGWSAWGITGAAYMNALDWQNPVNYLINLTCEGDWARTQVPREWVHEVWATPNKLPIESIHAVVGDLIAPARRRPAFTLSPPPASYKHYGTS
jgi:hypothetical protein